MLSDTAPSLPILNAERLEALDRRVRGSPGLRAIESSVTVVALGTVIYGGALLYTMLADTGNRLAEAVGDAVEGVLVSPIVFSDEGFQVLKENILAKKGGAIRFLEFNLDYQRARDEFQSTGSVKALPGTAARVKHWEDVIAHKAPELLGKGERLARVHPFDLAVGRLVNNRATFWGVVGVLALVPVVPVIGSIVKEGIRSNEH